MTYCPACGTANREGSRFCNQCGRQLVDESTVTCPRCGAANEPQTAHCQACGLDLAGQVQETPAPAQVEEPAPQEPAARRQGGLPPWLDAVENPEEPPLEEVPGVSLDEAEPPALEHLRRGDWSADALPIEPVVGVPYRARERRDLPPTPEQERAARLFGAVAAEEVHAAPQDVRPPDRMRRLAVSWRWLVAFALFFALLVPLIWPLAAFNVVAAVPAPVAAAASAIEDLPEGAIVLVAFEYDAGLAGELQPIAEAYLGQLLGHGARVLAVSTRPEGAALADQALDRALAAFPEARYGPNVANLGFVAGAEAGVRALVANLATAAPTDYRTGAPLASVPLTEGLRGARDLPLIVVVGSDLVAVQRWIEQLALPFGTALVAGVPALAEPAVSPYRTAGQLRGVVAGLGGAAALERLGTRLGPAGRMLGAVRTGIWVVVGVVILANLAGLPGALRRRRRG